MLNDLIDDFACVLPSQTRQPEPYVCFVESEIESRSVDQAVIVSDCGTSNKAQAHDNHNPHRTASTSTHRICTQTIKAITESSESSAGAPVIF